MKSALFFFTLAALLSCSQCTSSTTSVSLVLSPSYLTCAGRETKQQLNEEFLIGANIPWQNYGWDFQKHYQWGIAFDGNYWTNAFAEMRRVGSNLARIFVFCDGRASPKFDSYGQPIPLDAEFYYHFDQIVQKAYMFGVQLIPVLWNYDALQDNRACCGDFAGMHLPVFLEPEQFIKNVLTPLVLRYNSSSAIYAWEIMNEPEFAMENTNKGYTTQLVPFGKMLTFVMQCAETIHNIDPSAKVTVGAAHPDTITFWTDETFTQYGATLNSSFLDVVQVHVYPWSPNIETIPMWSSAYQKPLLIGETPSKIGPYSTVDQLYQLKDNNAAGILYWSYNNDGAPTLGNWTDIAPLVESFLAKSSD